jgi:small subunit ribosomal protein S6
MNQYETVFILTPVLSDDQMKEAVGKFKEILTSNNAEILYEENWGMRKLAYSIEKKSSGFYVVFGYKAEPTLPKKLETAFRRDERVLRYLTVKMEKYAAAYAAKRQSLKEKKED